MFEPRYIITHGMLRYIGQIDAAREVINNAALIPSWENKFREDAAVRTVHHGTHIEGNDLTASQAQKVVLVNGDDAAEVSQKTGVLAPERDIQEVINYRVVLDWIDKWGSKMSRPMMMTEEIVKEIHRMVVKRILDPENTGEYRKVQVAIKDNGTGLVTFMPPPAIEVPYLVQDFLAWVNSEEGRMHHSVLRAGITHYELVRIHPFVDGNGRVARSVATMLLYAEDYDVKKFFSLEEYFDRDTASYYRALSSVGEGDNMDLTEWLEYFCFGLAAELQRVKDQVLKLSRDMKLKGKLGKQVALSDRQIRLIEALNKTGKLSTSDANDMLPMVSPDTVLRDFKDLIDKGVIERHGKTKGAYYVLKS